MNGINKVFILGTVTKQPVTKETNGKWMATVHIQTGEGNSKEEHRCLMWGDAATLASEAAAGDIACIDGRIKTSSYTNRNGDVISSREIICSSFNIVSDGVVEEAISNDMPF